MVEIIIPLELEEKINKKFKGESIRVFKLLYSLKENPRKGKELAQINKISIKELKYKSFRFYFLVGGYKLKILEERDLVDLLIKFVAMSHKKEQQQTIEQIKDFLRKFGEGTL